MVIAPLSGKFLSRFSTQANIFIEQSVRPPLFHCINDKLHDFDGYFVHFETVYYLVLLNHVVHFLKSIHALARFFFLVYYYY